MFEGVKLVCDLGGKLGNAGSEVVVPDEVEVEGVEAVEEVAEEVEDDNPDPWLDDSPAGAAPLSVAVFVGSVLVLFPLSVVVGWFGLVVELGFAQVDLGFPEVESSAAGAGVDEGADAGVALAVASLFSGSFFGSDFVSPFVSFAVEFVSVSFAPLS